MNRTMAQRLFWITVLGIACIFVLLPLLRPGRLVTDDGDWMIIRLSAFYQSFREGQFPVRFLGRLNNSYGYPVSNFVYPGFLYMGSILHAIGLPFQSVLEIIIVGSVASGAIALFLWLRYFFDDRASVLGVASFIFMPYFLYDVFKRGSIGEILAMSTALVVVYAIESRQIWLLSPAVAFLALSHNTLAMFFIPILFGYLMVKRYWDLVIPFIFGVGMSAFFWLPVFFERHMVVFNSVVVSDPTAYFSVSHTILIRSLPFLIAALIGMFISIKSKAFRKERWYFFILLFASAIVTSEVSTAIWKNQSVAKVIQFPYRLFALWCFAGPWWIAKLAHTQKSLSLLFLSLSFVFLFIVVSLPYQKAETVVKPEEFFTTNESTTTTANEFMPKWINTIPTQHAPLRFEFSKGNATITERRVRTDKIDITVFAQEESVLQVNTIYYPGWGAMLDNKPITISYDNPMGVMRVVIPAGNHQLYMAFRETKKRFLADIVSCIFIVLFIILYIVPQSVKKTKALFIQKKRHV